MMVRTTKQIMDSLKDGNWKFDDWLKHGDSQEWVCCSDLKKEIIVLANKYPVHHTNHALFIHELQLGLCKSPEQEQLKDYEKSPVSGEQTGEDKSNSLEIGKGSSPVQNPEDYCEGCGHLLDSHLDEGKFKRCHSIYMTEIEGKLDSAQCECRIKNVQKKCTCNVPSRKEFEKKGYSLDGEKCRICGGRCGGAL